MQEIDRNVTVAIDSRGREAPGIGNHLISHLYSSPNDVLSILSKLRTPVLYRKFTFFNMATSSTASASLNSTTPEG